MFETSTKTVPVLPLSLLFRKACPSSLVFHNPFSFLVIVLLSDPASNGQPHEASNQSSFSSPSFHVQAPGLIFLWQESS